MTPCSPVLMPCSSGSLPSTTAPTPTDHLSPSLQRTSQFSILPTLQSSDFSPGLDTSWHHFAYQPLPQEPPATGQHQLPTSCCIPMQPSLRRAVSLLPTNFHWKTSPTLSSESSSRLQSACLLYPLIFELLFIFQMPRFLSCNIRISIFANTNHCGYVYFIILAVLLYIYFSQDLKN